MKNNILEYIILYVIIACVALVIATLARMSAVLMGFDGFTAFMVFIIVLVILGIVYLSIHVVLQNLMLPWIGNGLAKIPYFRKKIEQRQVIITEGVEIEPLDPASLEAIRIEQQENIAKEQQERLDTLLDYTRKVFALYLSDEHIEVLCQNMQVYANDLSPKKLQPVRVKELSITDLRHFGWNIWATDKRRSQMDVASFLKVVFPNVFGDTETDSIKRHLKDDERKGVIKIKENLTE